MIRKGHIRLEQSPVAITGRVGERESTKMRGFLPAMPATIITGTAVIVNVPVAVIRPPVDVAAEAQSTLALNTVQAKQLT